MSPERLARLLDSSILIDVLRGSPEAVSYLSSLDSVPACSEITRVEVLRGLRSPERRRARRLLESLEWVAVDRAVAERAGELGRRWRRSHDGIATADLIIAASAELLDAELATANVRHFPMFEGLEPPY